MTTKTTFSWFVDWIGGRFCQTTASPGPPLGQGVVSEIDALYSEIDRLKYENAALRSELTRVKEAAELLGVAFAYGLPTDKPTTDDARRFARSCEAVMNNPTAAALVEQARKVTP